MLSRDRQLAADFKARLLQAGVTPQAVIAYGSRAREDADPESDLDLLVIVDQKTPELKRIVRDCSWQTSLQAGIVLQTMVMSREETEHAPLQDSSFLDAVRAEGVTI